MGIGSLNAFGLHQYDNKTSFFQDGPAISEGIGYGIVLGVSAFFALLVVGLVWLDTRFGGTTYHSEEFNTAGRTIKSGLIAVDITSHWTWSSTMLQSTNQVFQYGVAGGVWFAAGAVIQIFFFGIVAVEIKRRAPTAHTVLEIVAIRWGNKARVIFWYFLTCTNVIVAAQLILGGSAVISTLTGVNIYAACFLIPMGVVVYTAVGGLKATFTSSYVHTVIIFITLTLFGFTVYATGNVLGSPERMYENLTYMAQVKPVANNRGGSYLTMWSLSGIKFGILQVLSCWGIVFVDQAYWQSAIAARPSATWKGYILGGLMWYAVPFGLSMSLGLTVNALDLPLTAKEGNSGLVPPAAALAVLGKGGGALIAVIVLMAITSSGSAEMVAVSSLLTYDIYKVFWNKKPTGNQLLFFARMSVVGFGLFMGVISVIFYKASIDLNFLYFMMATITCCGVAPLIAAVTWAKTTGWGACTAAIVGQILGIIGWLVESQIEFGTITVDTLQEVGPALTGACFSLLSAAVLVVFFSLMWPQNYDWRDMKFQTFDNIEDKMKDVEHELSPKALDNARRQIWWWSGGLCFILVIAWPLLSLPAGVFSQGYFTFWVILSLVWTLVALVAAALLPILEAGPIIAAMLKSPLSHLHSKQPEPSDSTRKLQPSVTSDHVRRPSEIVLNTPSTG